MVSMNRVASHITVFVLASGLTYLITHQVESRKFESHRAASEKAVKTLQDRIEELNHELVARRKTVTETFNEGVILKRQTDIVSVAEKKSLLKSSHYKPKPAPKKAIKSKRKKSYQKIPTIMCLASGVQTNGAWGTYES